MRPLAADDLTNAQTNALDDWLQAQKVAGGVEIFSLWESRVPTRPILPNYLLRTEPTPTPPIALTPTSEGQ